MFIQSFNKLSKILNNLSYDRLKQRAQQKKNIETSYNFVSQPFTAKARCPKTKLLFFIFLQITKQIYCLLFLLN